MGTVYKRGPFWWVAFKVPGGKRVARSTGLTSAAPEREARKVLSAIEAELANEVVRATASQLTVAEYAVTWTKSRRAMKLTNATKDMARLRLHALPELGALRLANVRVADIRRFVAKLRTTGLASRTVLSVYGLVRRLFADAVADELLLHTPCVLKRRDLPKKTDKDPSWRARAVYSREEVELLLSSGLVPLDRRVTYALAFLAGLREGEIAALRWRSYDRTTTPLGRLLVTASFTRANRVEKSTKTGQPREVPVHPALERVLDSWERDGFEAMFGRAPREDDLLVPNREGGYRTDNTFLKGLGHDLAALGLRPRRMHDARRTFISLGRTDGAADAVLKSLTHDQVGDQFDQYTTFSFEAKAAAVAKLGITGTALRAARVAASGAATPTATQEADTVRSVRNDYGISMDGGGLELSLGRATGVQTRGNRVSSRSVGVTRGRLVPVPCSNVATEAIVSALHEAMLEFARTGDRRALSARLRLVLGQVRR